MKMIANVEFGSDGIPVVKGRPTVITNPDASCSECLYSSDEGNSGNYYCHRYAPHALAGFPRMHPAACCGEFNTRKIDIEKWTR